MNRDEAFAACTAMTDGQPIQVRAKSGRIFDGIYNAELTDPDSYLWFDTLEGKPVKALWENVDDLSYRNARSYTAGGRMFIPPEHPLSGQGSGGVTPEGVPMRPHTKRNR